NAGTEASKQLAGTANSTQQSRGAFEALTETVAAAGGAFQTFRGGIGGVSTAISNLHPALKATAGVVAGLVAGLEASANAIGKVNEQAMRLGLGVQEFDKLRQGAQQAGLPVGLLADALGKLKEQGAAGALAAV